MATEGGVQAVLATLPETAVAFPVRVSDNGRYFVDANGVPVFWLGTTQWNLVRDYTLDEASFSLKKTAEKGFAYAQVMLMGVGDGTTPNLHGEEPWHGDDPLTPNEAYFREVDAVVRAAAECGLALSMSVYHQRYREHLTLTNARAWAEWIGARYAGCPNLFWSMNPEAKPEFAPIVRELAAGLRAGDRGAHLITFKPDPSPYSSSFLHHEAWLDFDTMQTWTSVELIYPMVTHDYHLLPTKPVLMGEGAYEAGTEYDFDVTPLWVRRQAYYSYLAGAHHTYGHNDSWRVLPTWRQALDAPGATQLGILKRLFLARDEWWHLVPDQALLATGGQTEGRVLNLAARHRDGRWAVAYLASPAAVSLRLDRLAGQEVQVAWVDPRTGETQAAGCFASSGTQAFSTPEGWEDAVLVLEAR